MPYVLTHDSIEETEITDTRRQTQTSTLKGWLILVKEKKTRDEAGDRISGTT